MTGLTSLDLKKYIFNTTKENNKFKIYTDTFHEFSIKEIKHGLEILSNSDITLYHLQHQKIGPRIIQAFKKIRSKQSSTDGYFIIIMGYARSLFEILKVILEF